MSLKNWTGLMAVTALALVACNGEKPTDTDPDTDTGTSAPPPPDYFEPSAMLVSGLFAYDADTNTARGYLTPTGSGALPVMELLLISDDYDPAFEDTYCSIVYSYDTVTNGGIPVGTWVTAADAATTQSVYFGFTWPETSTIDTDCDLMEFDPDIWGPDAVATITSQQFGLGISTLDADLLDALRTQVVTAFGQDAWDEDWAPYVFGGGFEWETVAQYGQAGGYMNFNYSNAFEVSETWILTYDDVNENDAYDPPTQTTAGDPLNAILASEITDGTPPSGAYSVQAGLGLIADCVADINNCLQ